MYIKSRHASVTFKLAAAAITLLGLCMNTGVFKGAFEPGKFLYFTILSNVFCLVMFVLSALGDLRRHGASQVAHTGSMRLKGAAVMAITTTLLIYWLLLARIHFAMDDKPDPLANLLVHLIVPLLMIADWALFSPKGRVRVTDPLWWTLAPLGYYVFTVAASLLGARYMGGGRYPYFFIDATVLGWGRTLINVVLVAIGFIAMGYAFYALDRWLGRLAAHRKAHTRKV